MIFKHFKPSFDLDPEFAEKDADATERIRLLALKLGLPEPKLGEPLNYILVGILEKLDGK